MLMLVYENVFIHSALGQPCPGGYKVLDIKFKFKGLEFKFQVGGRALGTVANMFGGFDSRAYIRALVFTSNE